MNIWTWRYRRFHESYVIVWLACGILLGLVFGGLWKFPVWLCTVAALALTVALLTRRLPAMVLAALAGLLLGGWRGAQLRLELAPYAEHQGQQVVMSGAITDDPDYGKSGEQRFRVGQVTLGDHRLPGQVYVTMFSIADVKRGDRVELRGKLSPGFGNYQAALRFATLAKAERLADPVRDLRDGFAAGVRNAVPEPAASLGVGFVVGQRSALPTELDDQLRAVGLTHIVVASGYNLTILVRFARRALARHSKYLAAMSGATLAALFVAVSGASPSMVRASLVTGLSLAVWYYGRAFHPLILIVLTAAITAFANPLYLWSDIGWWLSFLAFAGVLIVAPLATRLFWGKAEPGALSQIMVEATAAQVMTLPLILWVFGQLPLLATPANVLVAPVIPLAMALTSVAGVAGWLVPSLAGWVAAPAALVLEYSVRVVQWLASFGLQFDVSLPWWGMVAGYALVCGGCVWVWWRTRYDFRESNVVK